MNGFIIINVNLIIWNGIMPRFLMIEIGNKIKQNLFVKLSK